jgi:hypothetical protein
MIGDHPNKRAKFFLDIRVLVAQKFRRHALGEQSQHRADQRRPRSAKNNIAPGLQAFGQ